MQGNDIRDDKQIMPVTVDKLNLKYVRSDADQLDIHRNAHSPHTMSLECSNWKEFNINFFYCVEFNSMNEKEESAFL